jgi:5-methylthioadenosine/S-adenosylhomocysteine deaminase
MGRELAPADSQTRCRCQVRTLPLLIGLLVLASAPVSWAAITVTAGGDATKTVIRGTLVTPDQVLDGMLVIDGDHITCVAVSCDIPAGATSITVTQAFVFPGFVDAHNHVAYNVLPRWTPPKLYQRRSQWQGATAYKTFKKPLYEGGWPCQVATRSLPSNVRFGSFTASR